VVRLGQKYTVSDIAVSTFYSKSIYKFISVKDLKFDLRLDLEKFGI